MDNEMIATISKGQQITIPASIREMLGLDVGSKVDVEYDEGKILITPLGEELGAAFAIAKKVKPKHKLNAEQMDKLNEERFR